MGYSGLGAQHFGSRLTLRFFPGTPDRLFQTAVKLSNSQCCKTVNLRHVQSAKIFELEYRQASKFEASNC